MDLMLFLYGKVIGKMSKPSMKRILEHPDKDEFISKLVMGFSPKDVHDWLSSKYTNVSESKFVIAEKSIKSFQDNYLDIYSIIQEDIAKTKLAVNKSTEDQLEFAVNNSQAYKDIMLKTAGQELDIRKTIKSLCVAIETRLAQVFDEIQEDPRNINTRIDRLLIEYTEVLGNILEKYYKFTESPADQVVQHNVTLQVVDQHITVFHDVIKEVLSQMDLETSLYFMEVFNDKMAKLKPPSERAIIPTEVRLAEAKLLNENISKKLNE
jgi:hypothetical protein